MSAALKKVVITIECAPKAGQSDKLHAKLWAVIEKHARKQGPQSIQTDYVYEDEE